MTRFAVALLLALAVHVAAMVAWCALRRNEPEALRQLDLTQVELSFAEREEAPRVNATEAAAQVAEPRMPPPSVPPPQVPPLVEEHAPTAVPEPPVGSIVVGKVEIPVAPEEVQQKADESRRTENIRPPADDGSQPTVAAEAQPARDTARVDALPSPRGAFRPVYPRTSRRKGEEGTVLLSIQVDALGVVAGVTVAATSGFSALDEAAVAAVRRIAFKPASKDGRAVPSEVRLPITFKLSAR